MGEYLQRNTVIDNRENVSLLLSEAVCAVKASSIIQAMKVEYSLGTNERCH